MAGHAAIVLLLVWLASCLGHSRAWGKLWQTTAIKLPLLGCQFTLQLPFLTDIWLLVLCSASFSGCYVSDTTSALGESLQSLAPLGPERCQA